MKPKKTDFDLRQMEIFCRVAETGGFSQAAAEVSLSQPTVSAHISSLERSLGTKLLDRKGQEVTLTAAGKLLYDYALKMLSLKKEAKESMDRFLGAVGGELVIGGSTIPGTYILPDLISRFRKQHPGVEITLRIGDTKETIERVEKGGLELGVVGGKPAGRMFYVQEFCKDELALIVGRDHPWAARKSRMISLHELRNEPFVLRERGSGTRDLMAKVFKDKGVALSDLRVVCNLGSTESVKQGIASGIGVSILSKKAVKQEIECGILDEVRIRGVKFVRYFYLITHAHRTKSPACEGFLKFLSPKPKHRKESKAEN